MKCFDLKGVGVAYPKKWLDFSVCFCATLVITILKFILKRFSLQLLCKLALKECYRRLPRNKMWQLMHDNLSVYCNLLALLFPKRGNNRLWILLNIFTIFFFFLIFHPIKKTQTNQCWKPRSKPNCFDNTCVFNVLVKLYFANQHWVHFKKDLCWNISNRSL